MSEQLSGRTVTASAFIKSEAFRTGYEDVRQAKPAGFSEWGTWALAYEMGRQSAALALGRGERLREIQLKGKLDAADLSWLRELHRAQMIGGSLVRSGE